MRIPIIMWVMWTAAGDKTGKIILQNTTVSHRNVSNLDLKHQGYSATSLRHPRGHIATPLGSEEQGEEWHGSLGRMLTHIAVREMSQCNLVMAYDSGYESQHVLQPLLALPNPRQVGCRGYLLLLSRPTPLLTLSEARPLLWDYRGRYLCVLPSRGDLEKLAGSLKGRKTEHLAGVIKGESVGAWQVYVNQLYRGDQLVGRVATWRGRRFISGGAIYRDRVADLKGTTLKVLCVLVSINLSSLQSPSSGHLASSTTGSLNGSVLFRYGTDIGVLDTIARVMNFTVRYEEPPQGERWGREEENGTWSGMMGRLARNEVDIGLVDLYVTHVRIGILDYTTPYDSELSCFMARTEPPLPRWQALAFPFQGTTWMAIAVGLVVAGPVLALLARGSALCGDEEASLQSLGVSWYYALGLHCCEAQGKEQERGGGRGELEKDKSDWSEKIPRMQSTRVFVATLWIYTIILTIVYSTNLTAFLLVAKPPATIETIKDLHASGLEVSGVGKFYGDALGSASDPYLKSLQQKFRAYVEAAEIFPRVLRGSAVMIQNSPFLEFVAATRFATRGQSRMRLMKVTG
ncbi:hypothetical protein O3P69_013056 [Scylla paramamosain]|uniref:Ionotropic glutamate receptor L-glutamate and glycine-binding domain-containing protein n=1 Tax=Scylla paramamosain TaxID=85552 RepID=A0AAW0TVE4_SCYPA